MEQNNKFYVRWKPEEKKALVEDFRAYLKLRGSATSREEIMKKQEELANKYKRGFASLAAMFSRETRRQKSIGGE